jgi:hypothetical protein
VYLCVRCAQLAAAADGEHGLAAALLSPSGDVAAAEAALPDVRDEAPHSSPHGQPHAGSSSSACELLHEVVAPIVICLLGVGFSIAALWGAVAALLPGNSTAAGGVAW